MKRATTQSWRAFRVDNVPTLEISVDCGELTKAVVMAIPEHVFKAVKGLEALQHGEA